jgi:AAA domain
VAELLAKFVAAFKRGIDGELAAMRESAETFELALGRGDDLGGLRYSFELAHGSRVAAGSIAVLKSPRGEQRVVVDGVTDDRVAVQAEHAIDLTAPCALVVAPWFLYDRLVAALDEIRAAPLALMLFGKHAPARVATTLQRDHGALDVSQRAAVQLCTESELAFVWGPPGTGKTATLVHVVDELLANGERILIASTTNAAIDQLLAKLAARPDFAPGVFVRLGRSEADTFGAELADIVGARQSAQRDRLAKLRSRVGDVEQQLRYVRALAGELAPAVATQQSLFAAPPPKLRAAALSREFTAADVIAARDAREQLRIVEARIARLERVRELTKQRVRELGAEARGIEARVVADARVVMCTLTATYVSPLLATERFDVLIAEEAGMATLPPLFYAASRCDRRAIMVGDPRQLPPIVQSNDDAVRRAIGRNIFDVTVPDPAASPIVAMLEVQYRMHPVIGALVGGLFYANRLVHRPAADVAEIAAREPFAGRAVVVDDVRSSCERSVKGSSRVNAISAARVVELAAVAVRGGSRSIGVITPYAAQASEIRRSLAARGLADAVECSTIHRFQGREHDVVLIDLVDAQPMRPSALVADAPNLLNVSISRARGKLVIVADVAYWNTAAPDGLVAAMLHAATRM